MNGMRQTANLIMCCLPEASEAAWSVANAGPSVQEGGQCRAVRIGSPQGATFFQPGPGSNDFIALAVAAPSGPRSRS
ncbi:hypothetical protein PBS_16540 [Paraburkholderia sp. 2C]